MDSIKDQNNYFIRLDKDEEIFTHLMELAEKEKMVWRPSLGDRGSQGYRARGLYP